MRSQYGCGSSSQEIAPPSRLVSGDEGRTTAAKEVENDAIAAGDVLNRIGNHGDWFYRRVESEFIHATSLQSIDATILPDIGSVAAMLTQFKGVYMGSHAIFEGKDQFMPRPADSLMPPLSSPIQ